MNFERFSELWDKHVINNPDMDYTPNPDIEPYTMSEKTKKALIAYGQGDTSYFDKLEEQIKERKSEANDVAIELNKLIELVKPKSLTGLDIFTIWSESCPWSSVAYEHNFDNLHPHIKSKWECLAENVNKRIENTRNAH